MKTIILIITLLFGFNTYAMQEPIKTHSVEYKALSSTKINSKAIPKKVKNDNLKRLKLICKVVVVVFVAFVVLLTIAFKSNP